MTIDRLRLSNLSPTRKALVRLCQQTNYGEIRNLAINDGEPVLSGTDAKVVRDIKLRQNTGPRAELELQDFELSAEWVGCFAQLDEIGTGVISTIEILAGLPHRIKIESSI